MKMKTLNRRVLTLWYIKAILISLFIIAVCVSAAIILMLSNASQKVTFAVLLSIGIPAILLLLLTLIFPSLRYKLFSYGYDDKTIVVKHGVIFRERVVIPVCQIQDLHRTEGPIMMMLKLSDVTISTAGSNFDLSTLTTTEADAMIDELEKYLNKRIEAQKNEEI